jgi:hypothetical protein
MNTTINTLDVTSAYLRRNLLGVHALAEDYHDRAGDKTPTADQLIIQFLKHVEDPNCFLLSEKKTGDR